MNITNCDVWCLNTAFYTSAIMYRSLDKGLRQSRAASYWLTIVATEYRPVSLATFSRHSVSNSTS